MILQLTLLETTNNQESINTVLSRSEFSDNPFDNGPFEKDDDRENFKTKHEEFLKILHEKKISTYVVAKGSLGGELVGTMASGYYLFKIMILLTAFL